MPLKSNNRHLSTPQATTPPAAAANLAMVPAGMAGPSGAAPTPPQAAYTMRPEVSAMGLMTQLAALMAQASQHAECPGLQIFGGPTRAPRPAPTPPAADAGAGGAPSAPPPLPPHTGKVGGKGDADDAHLMEQLERAAAGDRGVDLPEGGGDFDEEMDDGDTGTGNATGNGKGAKCKGNGKGKNGRGKGKVNKGKGKANGAGNGRGKGKGNANGVMRKPSANGHGQDAGVMKRPAAAAGLGCSKCRYLPRGCAACR